jgi:DNA-damage-inducible protein D
MKKELIAELFEKFENARLNIEKLECWSARELQVIYDYKEWRNFHKVIEKAKTACENSNFPLSDHFVEFNKLVEIGSGTQREIIDLALTRYACYLIAQNGDPSKKEIAFAQTYFAVQTRKQEIVETRLLDIARVSAREKLTRSEKKLSSIIYERGIDDKGFAIIRSRGDKALFGGYSTAEMKQKLAVPNKNPLADYLPTLTIKAKDFATELTSHNVEEKNLRGMDTISTEHIDNNKSVRKILLERGVVPENLPPAEDVKRIKRRLNSEENKALKPESKKISKPQKP